MKQTIIIKKTNPFMKRFTLPLAATLCLLVSCQAVQPQAPLQAAEPQTQSTQSTHTIAMSADPELPQIAKMSYAPKPMPFGQVKALANQQLEVNFTYPDPQQFKTQSFACGEVKYASVAVSGPALEDTILYATGSDNEFHMLDANNQCSVSANVDAVPFGDLVVTIRLYDSERNLLAGSELISGFNVSEANPIVQMSYRQTNVGQILNQLRQTGASSDAFLAGQLDLSALQSFIDTLTNFGGTFPGYTFTNHPALINIPAIVADLQANGGNIAVLDPLDAKYVNAAGSLGFVMNGFLSGQDITASVDDVLSDDVRFTSDGVVTVTDLPPGTWTLRLSGPGYITQRIEVVIIAGQTTDLGTVTLLAPPATITALNPATGVSGESTVISGTNFNPTLTNNSVMFGTTTAAVTSVNQAGTELTVTVPNGLALEAQPVSLKTGANGTVTGPSYTVVKPTIDALAFSSGEIGSQLKITGTHFNATAGDNTVMFGTVTATINAATSTELTVAVPEGVFGSVPITVLNLESPASNAKDYAITPKINALSVSSGSSADVITISGSGFDTTSANNTVKLGSHTIDSPTATDTTELEITVPNIAAGTANVTVTVGDQISAAANFSIGPKLTTVSTTAGAVSGKAILIPGDVMTIVGTNFDRTEASNSVKFGSISVTPTAASATQLTVTVPDNVNVAGDVAMTVVVDSQTSNTVTATVPKTNLDINGGYY